MSAAGEGAGISAGGSESLLRRAIAALDPLYLLAVSPLLLFPTVRPLWTAAALGGLVLVWFLRAIIRREVWPATPFNAALLCFSLTIPLAVWASAIPELTLPKLTGLILGLAAFRAVGFAAARPRGLAAALVVFILLGLGMWVVGLLGVQLPVLAPLVQRLPAALVSLPGAPDQGINPNQLAGILSIYLPLMLAALVMALRGRHMAPAALLALGIIAAGVTLFLTRSRAGWAGVVAAAAVLGFLLVWFWKDARLKRVILGAAVLIVVACLVLVVVLFPQLVARAAQQVQPDALSQMSLAGRVEIWSRALYALQDFPFTGVGLGTFRRVVNLLYPLFVAAPDSDIAHAHNIFLQVGLDLGLGGLVAYVALLIVAGVVAFDAARRPREWQGLLALGLLISLVGLHVYGLADALAPGSKPGIAFWMVLGLLAALANAPPRSPRENAISEG